MQNSDMEEMWVAMKNSRYKSVIEEIRESVKSSNTIADSIEKALNVVVEASHSVAGTFWYHDRFYDNMIYPRAVYGGSKMDGIKIAPGVGFAGKCIQDGKSITVFDCSNDSRFAANVDKKTGFITKTMMCVPLKIGDVCFGCIQIINKTDGLLFDEKDLSFVEDLANILTYVMSEKGMLNDYIANKGDLQTSLDDEKLNIEHFNHFKEAIKQSYEYIKLSYLRQQEVMKSLENIRKILNIK